MLAIVTDKIINTDSDLGFGRKIPTDILYNAHYIESNGKSIKNRFINKLNFDRSYLRKDEYNILLFQEENYDEINEIGRLFYRVDRTKNFIHISNIILYDKKGKFVSNIKKPLEDGLNGNDIGYGDIKNIIIKADRVNKINNILL